MFRIERHDNMVTRAATLCDLIFHATARQIRKGHGNGFKALVMNIVQSVTFILTFIVMFSVLGLRGSAVRGDFVLYIMSGVFLFMTHIKTISTVMRSEGPASPMMKHAPMNTAIAIVAAALSAAYVQLLSVLIILFAVHVGWHPVVIDDAGGTAGMLALAWFSGVGIGILLLAVKPWAPNLTTVVHTIYSRINMIASGKMFVANMLPAHMIGFFDWNPLFHIIDQSRGFAFINYNPHYTNWEYALKFGTICLMVGMMGEFYTRRSASISWFADR